MTEVGLSLSDAVERNIRPGDSVHVMLGHSRWTAAAREMARQFWGADAGMTLIMSSLGALGALFFRGGMVRKVVTAYSGNSFPSYAPNPIFKQAYESGDVAVEHWSILTLGQRLEAAARGLPAIVTGSVVGSDLADNQAFSVVDSEFGPVGLLAPLVPDVALCHAALSDIHGNLAISEPMLEGTWGAWAARRGVVATVESIVPDLDELGPPGADPGPPGAGRGRGALRRPSRRVLRPGPPGGRLRRGHPLLGRGRRRRPRRLRRLGPGQPAGSTGSLRPTSSCLGDDRLIGLRLLSDPDSWRHDAEANPVPTDEPISDWEVAASLGAREVAVRGVRAPGRRRAGRCRRGQPGRLGGRGPGPGRRELGLPHRRAGPVGLHPDTGRSLHLQPPGLPGDLACCPTPPPCSAWWSVARGRPPSAAWARPRWTSTGTSTPPGWPTGGSWSDPVGPTTWSAGPRPAWWSPSAGPSGCRPRPAYVTAPGERVTSVVTDRGILRRIDGRLRVAAVPSGPDPLRRAGAGHGRAPAGGIPRWPPTSAS